MLELNLNKNECIILANTYVIYDGKALSQGHELILTNQNLIVIEKGFFKTKKVLKKIAINTIKILNGKPSIIIHNNNYILISHFEGEDKFGFQNKKEAIKWINKITDIVCGIDIDLADDNRNNIPIVENVAGFIKDAADTFINTLFPKKNNVIKCKHCGAQIYGKKGNDVKCSFCNNINKL